MKNIAVYPGTFDPITNGHIDLIDRASKLFDQVIVAIAAGTHKTPLFSLSERVALAEAALVNYANVSVSGFSSLLLSFAREHNANVILRGLRTVTDFDYEIQLASMNRSMDPTIQSLFLMPAEKYLYLSASMVREISMLGGNVAAYVPSVVLEALEKKSTR